MNAAEFVTQFLPDAKATSSGWQARCPAHDDSTPSLSVGSGDSDRVLLKCFAGCTTEAICQKVGVSLRDLFTSSAVAVAPPVPVPQPKAKKAPPIFPTLEGAIAAYCAYKGLEPDGHFLFHDADGAVVFAEARFLRPRVPGEAGKRKKVCRPFHPASIGWWQVGKPKGDVPLPFYNLPAVVAAIRAGTSVWVCEGPRKAAALNAVGLTATAFAFGAEAVLQFDFSPLAGGAFVLWPDHDASSTGVRCMNQVAAKLFKLQPPGTVRYLAPPSLWPGMPDKGDAIDYLEYQRDELAMSDAEILAKLNAVAAATPSCCKNEAVYEPASDQRPVAAAADICCPGAEVSPELAPLMLEDHESVAILLHVLVSESSNKAEIELVLTVEVDIIQPGPHQDLLRECQSAHRARPWTGSIEERQRVSNVAGAYLAEHYRESTRPLDIAVKNLRDARLRREGLLRLPQLFESFKNTSMLGSELLADLRSTAKAIEGTPSIIKGDPPTTVQAAVWLQTPLTPPAPVLIGVFDRGAKAAIVGPSKMHKSFCALQLGLSIATGREFLGWSTVQGRVLLVNLEIDAASYQLRLRKMAAGMGIDAAQLVDLDILNVRGHTAVFMSVSVSKTGVAVQFDSIFLSNFNLGGYSLLVIDPLYKVLGGDENSGRDVSPTLDAFTTLAEETGAAVLYVHHCAKGNAGDRATIDRGAGSGRLARDYDACLTLTPHAVEGLAVLETIARNHPPPPKLSVQFDTASFQFVRNETEPDERRTGARRPAARQHSRSDSDAAVIDYVAATGPLPASVLIDWIHVKLAVGATKARTILMALEHGGKVKRKREAKVGGHVMIFVPSQTV